MNVFVSHSKADSQFVDSLRLEMERLGISVFDPATELEPGATLEGSLRTALENCDAMVYVAPAPETTGANSAFFEVGAARALGKRIVTILPNNEKGRLGELPQGLSISSCFEASRKSPNELAKSVVSALEAA